MSRGTGIVTLALIALLVYVGYNTLSTEGPGSRGVGVGQPIPPFAAPLALANLECPNADGDMQECDANVSIKPVDGGPIACDSRGPNVLNSCELTEDSPLVLGFLVAPSSKCVRQIDVLDTIAKRFPDVSFAAVAIKGDHDDLNEIIRSHGWTIPVAYDHDGAVANAFAVAICPTITFADQGGRVRSTTLGEATSEEIVSKVKALR